MSDRLGKLRLRELPTRGVVNGAGAAIGSIVQKLGSRETFVADGKGYWESQNDDLGAKLDAIQAAVETQLFEQRQTNEFLAVIAAALTQVR